MHVLDSQLKQFVLDAGLVPRAELVRAEAERGERTLADELLASGALTEDDVRRVSAYMLGIPFVSLRNQSFDFDTLTTIPEPISRNHNAIAYKESGEGLEVAFLDTADMSALDFVRTDLGKKIVPRLTDTLSMKTALRHYQKTLRDAFGDIIMRELASLGTDTGAGARIVDALLQHALAQRATDIHLESLGAEMLVRYRISGVLHDAMTLPHVALGAIASRLKELAHLSPDMRGVVQDGRFRMETKGQKLSVRLSVVPVHGGEKIVMRLLREHHAGFTLEGIGFHGEGLEVVRRAMRAVTGLVLVSAPPSMGKTTTLYTILDLLNDPAVSIATIEKPIEHQIPRVSQTEVRPEQGLSYAVGFRAVVRQDPDVIMVGDATHPEVASLSVATGLRGHLVFGATTTASAPDTISAMISAGAMSEQLASALSVVITSRLARRLASTKEAYILSPDEYAVLSGVVDMQRVLTTLKEEGQVPQDATWYSVPLYRPTPSVEYPEGYDGLVGIHEVLPISSVQKEIIAHGADATSITAQGRYEGVLSLREDAVYKAALGLTSLEEALRVTA